MRWVTLLPIVPRLTAFISPKILAVLYKADLVFPIVKPLNIGKKGAFITVDGTEVLGDQFSKIRVLIEDPTQDLEYVTPAIYAEQAKIDNTPKEEESEADAIERIKERFDILDRMTHAVAEGTVRGMIVSLSLIHISEPTRPERIGYYGVMVIK